MTRARAMQWCVEYPKHHLRVGSGPGVAKNQGDIDDAPAQVVHFGVRNQSASGCPFFNHARQVFLEC